MAQWSERQVAMLREMGVQHFWPLAAAQPQAVAPAPVAPRPGRAAAGTPGVPSAPLSAGLLKAAEALPVFTRDQRTGAMADAPSPQDARGASADIGQPGGLPPAAPAQPSGAAGGSPVPAARPNLAPPPAVPAAQRSATDQQALAAIGQRPAGIEQMDWDTLRQTVAGCTACGLCQGRRQTVFGVGNTSARWMLVGEAPGEQEDRQGEPFVGRSGQLLDRMLMACGLTRQEAASDQQVYIANVIKCRPPGNRNPLPEEVAQCEPYLLRQMALVQPKLILAMGRFAVQSLLRTTEPIGRLRGKVHDYHGVPLIVTYHPAYLLRNPADKALAWDDLCRARELIRQG